MHILIRASFIIIINQKCTHSFSIYIYIKRNSLKRFCPQAIPNCVRTTLNSHSTTLLLYPNHHPSTKHDSNHCLHFMKPTINIHISTWAVGTSISPPPTINLVQKSKSNNEQSNTCGVIHTCFSVLPIRHISSQQAHSDE